MNGIQGALLGSLLGRSVYHLYRSKPASKEDTWITVIIITIVSIIEYFK